MRTSWFVATQSVILALILHAVVLALLLISFQRTPELRTAKPVSIVNAVTVDKARVEEEVKRLQQEEEKKRSTEKRRVEELEKKLAAEQKKAEEIKQRRLDEEQRLLEAKKQKEEELKKQAEAKKKVAELEEQRKLEEQKKAEAEAEKIRLEEEKKQKEEEQKKKEEERRRAEEERKRAEAEKAMQKQLAEEERQAQEAADRRAAADLGSAIHDKIAQYFNLTGLPPGLSCKLRVNLLPSGDVVGVSIQESSGNDIFDGRAVTAVQKASPLPVPQDAGTFERLNLRDMTFVFKP